MKPKKQFDETWEPWKAIVRENPRWAVTNMAEQAFPGRGPLYVKLVQDIYTLVRGQTMGQAHNVSDCSSCLLAAQNYNTNYEKAPDSWKAKP